MSLLDRQLVERFSADGYVLTAELLDLDELDRYRTAIDNAVASRTADDTRSVTEKGTYEQSFVQCMRLWETNSDVAGLTFDARLAQAAAELLGVDSVVLWQDQALYKEPGGRITDPHQDATFWPIGDAPLVSAWIPLERSTIANGAIGYVPGSHKVGALRAVNLLHTTEPYDILSDPALDGREPVFVEAEPGSVVWHHGMTVHGAKPNATDMTRRAFTVVYLAAGYVRTKPSPNFPLDRAGVGVGDVMQGEGLPTVWPHPGVIPAPPAVIGEPTGPQVEGAT